MTAVPKAIARKSRDWLITRPDPSPGSVTFDKHGRLIDAYSGKPVTREAA